MEPVTDFVKPRIYIACLAAHKDGILHGAWIDAAQDAWAIYDGISAMLKASPVPDAEEWAIHDHEGFEGVHVAEHAGIDAVTRLAAFIVEHGRLCAELIGYFGGVGEARQAIEERYHGAFCSLADYVQEVTEGNQARLLPPRRYSTHPEGK